MRNVPPETKFAESDEELGEMIDEWDEEHDGERQGALRTTNNQSTTAGPKQQLLTSKPAEPRLDIISTKCVKKRL